MLNIRPFIEDQDEPVYIDILNRAMAEFSDFTPMTLTDAEIEKNAPNIDKQGRFIAEWRGVAAGYVYAYLDTKREDKLGFLDGPFVIPEFCRNHIGTALAELAFKSFQERGINKYEAGARNTNIPAQKFVEKLGFKMYRVFSRMKHALSEIPENVGENKDVVIKDIGTDDEALKLENALLNEAMKEHFNFRPVTLEETKYYTREQQKQGVRYNDFVAYVNDVPAGLMITSIDPKEIEHQQKKVAWLSVLGVLKPYRSQGIGKALMIHAMKFLKGKGMDEAMLGVDDTNITKPMKIYESLGFEVVFKFYRYLKES
ncbi:MAG: GNAT family N-acetyltransferase [Candidatus Latescibacteria bacterium]|nr:GNAT family N-acetyltransferase [Candidatus Latescibacterota bacterium]